MTLPTVTLQPTDMIVSVNGSPARLWTGHSGAGLEVFALISVLCCSRDADTSELDQVLTERLPLAGAVELERVLEEHLRTRGGR
jgi:hypothetical protein